MTLVSIITPTLPGREDLLIGRCAPSIAALAWPSLEWIVVSDRNPELVGRECEVHDAARGTIVRARTTNIIYLEDGWRDGVREKSVGAVPWARGSALALGEYVGFVGDDDELLPDHVRRHVEALEDSGADFSVSRVLFRVDGVDRYIIGDATFAHGHLDSDGIMCRASALRAATWTATGEDAADWRLVRDWLAAGLRGVFIGGEPTAIHHDGWAAR